MSFLEAGNDIPSRTDGIEPVISTHCGEDLSQASQPVPQSRTTFNEPPAPGTIRTPSPRRSDRAEKAIELLRNTPILPSYAPAPREHVLSDLQLSDHKPISPAIPSPTAIPIHFRTPRLSVGFARSHPSPSPAIAPDSPSTIVPRTRHARPGSTEFRPLWLVERHKSREQFDPEEPYPALPSSKSSSRTSSVHDTEEVKLGLGDSDFVLGANVGRDLEPPEVLDSQQPTPVATTFHQAVQHNQDPEEQVLGLVDTETDHAANIDRLDDSNSALSSPSLRSLGNTSSKPPTKILSAQFEDVQDLPPLPPSSHSSMYGDDELLSTSAVKDAAVAIGTLVESAAMAVPGTDRSDKQMTSPSEISRHIHLAEDGTPSLNAADHQPESIESERESGLPSADKQLEGPYWQTNVNTTRTSDQSSTIFDGPTKPAALARPAALISSEKQRELQEQDAQDAVDSWFAPPTSKKAKKEKKSKEQNKSTVAKGEGVSTVSPAASIALAGLIGPASLVAVEALTEIDHDSALNKGLTERQRDHNEPRSTPVPLSQEEAG